MGKSDLHYIIYAVPKINCEHFIKQLMLWKSLKVQISYFVKKV